MVKRSGLVASGKYGGLNSAVVSLTSLATMRWIGSELDPCRGRVDRRRGAETIIRGLARGARVCGELGSDRLYRSRTLDREPGQSENDTHRAAPREAIQLAPCEGQAPVRANGHDAVYSANPPGANTA